MKRIGEDAKFVQLQAPAAKTATVTTSGADTTGFHHALLLVDMGAVSGTSPTLDIKLQESDDDSSYSDISGAALAQIVAAGANKAYEIDVVLQGQYTRKKYLRAVGTIGGTTPSFTFGMVLVLDQASHAPVVNSPAVVMV